MGSSQLHVDISQRSKLQGDQIPHIYTFIYRNKNVCIGLIGQKLNAARMQPCIPQTERLPINKPPPHPPKNNKIKISTYHNFFYLASVQLILITHCYLFCVIPNDIFNISIGAFS